MAERLYRYVWGNNSVRAKMKGRICRLLATGAMGSAHIEFIDNGDREITSRRALRRAHG